MQELGSQSIGETAVESDSGCRLRGLFAVCCGVHRKLESARQ